MANNRNNVENGMPSGTIHQNFVPQNSTDLLIEFLRDTQTRMENIEKRINALAAQLGKGQKDTHSSPPRTEQELFAHSAPKNETS